LKLKLAELLDQTQDGSRKLPLNRAIVAWFGGAAALHSDYVPLDALSCVVLVRGRRPYIYRDGERKLEGQGSLRAEHPAFVVVAPVIYHGNTLCIGGEGWQRYRKASKIHFTQDNFPGAKPAGAVRDLLCKEFKNPVSLITSSDHIQGKYHRKLLRWAHRMQSEETLINPKLGLADRQSIVPPTFLVPKRQSPLKLRLGQDLERWTIHCAETGRWSVPGALGQVGETSTQDRGEVTVVDAHTIHFKGSYEDDYKLSLAQIQYEKLIGHVFGRDDVVVSLVPVVKKGEVVLVKCGQALYGPLRKKSWSVEEFRALPKEAKMAAFYLAALSSARFIDGVYYLDFTHAYGDEQPIVDLNSVKTIQGTENTPHGLRYKAEGIHIDLVSFIRYHLKQNAEERKKMLPRKAEKTNAGNSVDGVKPAKVAASKSLE